MKKSESYEYIRNLAHQKPSSFCSEKAIVRHRSVWIENTKSSTGDGVYSRYSKIRDEIESEFAEETRQLSEVFDALKRYADQYFKEGKAGRPLDTEYLQDSERFCVRSGSDREGRYSRILIAQSYNRVTIKHIIDVNYVSRGVDKEHFHQKSRVHEEFKKLSSFIDGYNETLDYLADREKDMHAALRDGFWLNNWADCQACVNYLYDGIWNEVDREYWDPVMEELNHRISLFGDIEPVIFADFRGLILPAHKDIPTLNEGFLSNRFSMDDYELLRRNWPVVKANEYQQPADSNSYFSANDIIACGMGARSSTEINDGAGIYVSSLGQQNKNDVSPSEREKAPVRYLLLAKNRNYRQIGRLVDRVERLGCYRLLALRDVDKLRKIGSKIQIIGEAVDRLGEVAANSDRLLYQEVEEIGKDIQTLGKGVEGGLAYRVFVSGHYSRSLKEVIELLDVQKITGFETYEEFVRRQLYQVYDYIDELGARRERLQRRYNALVARAQIESIDESSQKTNRLMEIGHAIELFAITYYGGTIVASISDGMGVSVHKAIIYIGVAVIWFFCGSKFKQKVAPFLSREKS